MIMLPSTMLSVLTVSLVSARARLTRTRVEEEEVCPAKSRRSASPLGTWKGERTVSDQLVKLFRKLMMNPNLEEICSLIKFPCDCLDIRTSAG